MGLQFTFIYFVAFWTCFIGLFASLWTFVVFVSSQNDHFSISDDRLHVGLRLIINCLLLGAFFIQHSLMASTYLKQLLGNHCLYRSLYVAATAITLQILTRFWCFIPEIVFWRFETSQNPLLSWFFFAVHSVCWFTVYGTSILMDFAELVGLKQIYYCKYKLGDPVLYKSNELKDVYAHMRHPSFFCFCLLLVFRSVMTLDRLILAVLFLGYMLVSFRVDENDYRYQKEQCRFKWNGLRT